MGWQNGEELSEPEATRAEMGVYTRLILRFVKLRTDAALGLVRYKEENGLPTYDGNQEQRVIDVARKDAIEIGVNPDVAETLVLELMKHSYEEQEKLRQELAEAASEKGD